MILSTCIISLLFASQPAKLNVFTIWPFKKKFANSWPRYLGCVTYFPLFLVWKHFIFYMKVKTGV